MTEGEGIVESGFNFSEEQTVTQTHRKKQKKLSELEGSLPPVNWSKTRQKPVISGVWDEETAEELAKYIDWHGRHPHCVTPRKLDNVGGHVLGRKIIDEEVPGTYYTDNGIRLKPPLKEFLPPPIGADGDWDEVSSVAMRTEYQTYLEYGHSDEDPWFLMSVKDNLEQSHMDGSHTTVKSKPVKPRKLSEFEREAERQQFYFGGYKGGAPPLSEEDRNLIDRLSLADKSLLGKPRQKISPWQDTHVYSKFCAKGTALKGFTKHDLDDRVKVALMVHNNPYTDDRRKSAQETSRVSSRMSSRQSSRRSMFQRISGQQNISSRDGLSSPASNKFSESLDSPGSSRPSSKKSSRKSKKQKEDTSPERDRYDVMQEKLGGPKQLQQLEASFVKLAKRVTKKAEQKKAFIDTSINLLEACDKLRVLKVTTLLLTGQGQADMMTPDDETLFLHCIQKAIKLDNTTSLTKVNDDKQDSSDRRKLQKILELLIKYGAKINSMKSKDSLAAVHMAAIADNAKLLDWLIKNGASVTIPTHTVEQMTPLMLAAKYGNVNAIVTIVESGLDVNHQNPLGRTALHVAACFGQTRTALFLLRIGAQKKIQDHDHKTAAELAQQNHFLSTAQALAAFSMPSNRYKEQMDYMVQEFLASQQKRPTTVSERVSTAASSILSNLLSFDPSRIFTRRNWDKMMRKLRLNFTKKWAKINPFQSSEESDDEDDVDIDQIEEIARQRLLEENPELVEQESLGDGHDNGMDFDEESFGSFQDGDQVIPFDDH